MILITKDLNTEFQCVLDRLTTVSFFIVHYSDGLSMITWNETDILLSVIGMIGLTGTFVTLTYGFVRRPV